MCVKGVSAQAEACGWCTVYLLGLRRVYADVRYESDPVHRHKATKV